MTSVRLVAPEGCVVFRKKPFTYKRKSAKRKYLNEKAFFSGREGFRVDGYNPYRRNSIEYKEWERGYNKQYFINLNKIERNTNNVDLSQ